MPETNCICPNCGKPAIREGNEISCEHCDATFKITKTNGARIKKAGRLEDIEARLAALEGKQKPDNQNQIDEGQDDQGQDDQGQDDQGQGDQGQGDQSQDDFGIKIES